MRGARASLVWGYRPAAQLGAYVVERRRKGISKGPWIWTLRAPLTGTFDAFALRQRPLLLSAPRRGGFWCWPVQTLHVIESPRSVIAQLGPPEQ